jgi:hypothetical protein
MTSSSKIPYSDDRRNITITLDVLGEFCRSRHDDHSISGLLTWLRDRQKNISDENGAILSSGYRHKEKPVKTDAGQYALALDALKSSGADLAVVKFIFENTGIVIATCERLVALRVDGIEENVLYDLLQNVFISEEGGIE